MQPHLALIALLLLPSTWGHHEIRVERRHVGAWTLVVQTDRFSGRVTCQLSKHKIGYERQALVFHLSDRVDTSDAVYKIDGGLPVWVRSDAMELAHLGFALHNDTLANPSGGLVRLPERSLLDAHLVAVQPKAGDAPVNFKIEGFRTALETAHNAGCDADAFN
jgi:hypothetical protein